MSRTHRLGSSPSKLNILKKRLSKLDSQLCEFNKFKSNVCIWMTPDCTVGKSYRLMYPEKYKKLLELDEKRKQVRNTLKGY